MLRKPLLTLCFLLTAATAFCQQNYYIESYNVDTTTLYSQNLGTMLTTPALGSTLLQNGNTDVMSDTFSLPFDWTFFGQTVRKYRVSDNGYLTFDINNVASEKANQALPDSELAPLNSIFAFWDDLDLKAITGLSTQYVTPSVKAYTYGKAPNRVEIVQWFWASPHGVAASVSGGGYMNFAIRIYEAGGFDIIHELSNIPSTMKTSATIGAQNANGTAGTQVKNSPFLSYPGGIVYRFLPGTAPAYDVEGISLSMANSLYRDAAYYEVGDSVKFTFNVHNLSSNDITSMDVNFEENGHVHTQTVTGLSIPSNGGYGSVSGAWIPTSNGGTTFKVYGSNLNGSNPDQNTSNDAASEYVYISNKLEPRHVLFEDFTNAGIADSAINSTLDTFLANHSAQITPLRYFVTVQSNNSPEMVIGESNTHIRNYGVSTVPVALVDALIYNGNPYNGYPTFIMSRDANSSYYLLNQHLASKGTFKLRIDNSKSGSDNTFTITATSDIDTKDSVRLYAAVIEDPVVYATGPVFDNVKVFHDVVRAMLPVNGTDLGKMTEGQSKQVTLTYTPDMSVVKNAKNLKLAVWVQNIKSGDIQNSALSGAGLVSGINTPENSIITSVYPNPASESTTLTFKLDNASQVSANLVDVAGRQMMNLTDGQMAAGEHTMQINLSTLAKGVYFVHMNADGNSYTQKIVVD
jgi:hypothetical protein